MHLFINSVEGLDNQPSEQEEIEQEVIEEAQILSDNELVDIIDMVEHYRQDKLNKGRGETEVKAVINACLLTHELIGSRDMSNVKRDQVNQVILLLKQYPKNAKSLSNKKHFAGLTAIEIINKNEKLGLPLRQEDVVLRDLGRVSSLYKWSIRHNYITYNPFEGIAESKSKSKRTFTNEGIKVPKDRKEPFNKADLKKIFSHPIYTQGKFTRRQGQRLNYQYWVMLIAYTTGARPNEICQLMVNDVSNFDGILCFIIQESDDTQSLKNDTAARIIPVPDILLKLGFEQYLESVKSKKQLFPELTYTTKSGYYGKVEKWFQRNFSQTMGLSAQSKSFYSFRHTFMFDFQDREKRCPIVASLIGHLNGNISDDVYGGHFSIKRLKDKIDEFQYLDELKKIKPYTI